MERPGLVAVVLAVAAAVSAGAEEKPVALMGFPTDVKSIESDVMKPGRYVYESMANGWVDPADYERYSVLYFGEKMDGGAKGRSFRRGEADAEREALAAFLDGGGVVIVGGEWCMRQLFGWPDKKNPDPLRARIANIPKCVGRLKATYSKA